MSNYQYFQRHKSLTNYLMKTTLLTLGTLALLLSLTLPSSGQCDLLETPVAGMTLTSSEGGTGNRSGLAYSPLFDLYYSVNAGSSSYPIDVYDADGEMVYNEASNFDYRGAWYNPENGQIEGNGYGSLGLASQNLNIITGIPTGSVTPILAAAQPDAQSCGDLNTSNNEIVYYHNGSIHRYDREDNSLISSHTITGLPNELANMNTNTVIYTGCPTYEYGVYHRINQELYLINSVNFIVSAIVELPIDAPTEQSFKMAYTNNLFWLYQPSVSQWWSYDLFEGVLSTDEPEELKEGLSVFPNPATKDINVSIVDDFKGGTIRIADITGKTVMQWTQNSTEIRSVDISRLRSGLYLITLEKDSVRRYAKFIKE